MAFEHPLNPTPFGRPSPQVRVTARRSGRKGDVIHIILGDAIAQRVGAKDGQRVACILGTGNDYGYVLVRADGNGRFTFRKSSRGRYYVSIRSAVLGRAAPERSTQLQFDWCADDLIIDVSSLRALPPPASEVGTEHAPRARAGDQGRSAAN